MGKIKTNYYEKYLSNHFFLIHGKDFDLDLFIRYFRKNYKRFLPENLQSKVLDFGCGMGHFLYFLKKFGYINRYAVDISQESVDYCLKKNLVDKNKVFCGDGLKYLSETKHKFDLVVMNDVIEHIPKDEIVSTLKQVRMKLKKEGKVIIKVVNSANPITGASSRYLDFTHTTGFTEESLAQVLRMSGFDRVEIFAQNMWVFNPVVNFFGSLGQKMLGVMFRLLFLLCGRKSTKIFTKDIIAVATKE
jgi:SAM-dependent methyltransferase